MARRPGQAETALKRPSTDAGEDGTLHFWELVEATPLRRTKSHEACASDAVTTGHVSRRFRHREPRVLEAALLCLAFHEDTLAACLSSSAASEIPNQSGGVPHLQVTAAADGVIKVWMLGCKATARIID